MNPETGFREEAKSEKAKGEKSALELFTFHFLPFTIYS